MLGAAPVQAQPQRQAAPRFGTLAAAATPASVAIEAGGPDRNAIPGSGCSGFIQNSTPVATVTHTGGPLSIYVTSGTDTTLLVSDPSGRWQCSDDADDINPGVTFSNGQAGTVHSLGRHVLARCRRCRGPSPRRPWPAALVNPPCRFCRDALRHPGRVGVFGGQVWSVRTRSSSDESVWSSSSERWDDAVYGRPGRLVEGSENRLAGGRDGDLDGATVVLGAGARDEAGRSRRVSRRVTSGVRSSRRSPICEHVIGPSVWPRRMRSTLYWAVVTP